MRAAPLNHTKGRAAAFPRIGAQDGLQVHRISPHGATLSANERFPKDFWLTPRTVLTRATPISKLNHFCVRHGALTCERIAAESIAAAPHRGRLFQPPRRNAGFFLSDLSGFTADEKRSSYVLAI
jgi:hypothetical protein